MRPTPRTRRLLGPGLGLCLAFGVSACGAEPESQGAASKGSASPTSTPSEAAGSSPTEQPKRPSKPLHEPRKGPSGGQGDVLTNLPGNRSGACTPVGVERDVRSGRMGAGPFNEARASFSARSRSSRKVDLYFIPTHAAKMTGVTVTARNADTGARVKQKTKMIGDADQWKFYQLRLDLPDAGTWVLRARTVEDQGCWVVDLT